MSGEGAGRRYLTIMLVPDRGQESRTFRLSYRTLRAVGSLAAVAALALTMIAGSWWYLAARASRVSELEAEIRSLEADRARVEALARELEGIERQYARIREMFGAHSTPAPSDLWVPPAGTARSRGRSRPSGKAGAPSSWPLTETGFVTQGLLDSGGNRAEHPGLDIAVPTGSYVRAAGAGTVVDVGEDPIYGRFVVIDHGDGYTTLYGHASLNLVDRGQRVRQNEVIALSGSTGRSTAPHLHFEVLLNGEAVDPLTLVEQP
ncbi:MAG TPA: peptidoglycan DD-metalloendopeptidase family protein [Longimicrobiales bacterium]|nr:peptidoglycan DD-metalloendopeptidase family protein [Longimicrobiales bacterium]